MLAVGPVRAQDATWLSSPGTSQFNTGANWSTGTVPTGTATFGSSGTTSVTISGTSPTLNAITFSSVAAAYTLSVTGETVTFNGAGFTNNSGRTQTLNLDSSSTLTLNNSSSLSNLTVNNNGGTINFNDNSTAANSIINNTGSTAFIQFDDNSTASNVVVHNTGGATFCFCNSADPANMIVYNGTSSTLRFDGNNSSNLMRYIGQGGTFNLSGMTATSVTIGSVEGSGTIDLGANGLSAGANNLTTTFSGDISGSGTFTKVGSGTLTLSGTNSLTGLTTVSAGQLLLTGSVAGSVQVNSGTAFGGTGTVGGNLTNSGGTLMGGNPLSTLTVTGNFSQTSGTYQAAVGGTNQATLISAGGTASLGGTVNIVQAGSVVRDTRYTIVKSTGTLSGTFSGATSNFAFLTPTLSYDTHDAYVTLSLGSSGFSNGARTPNQRAVGAALDRAASGTSGDFNNVINALASLDTTQGPLALDMIAGQNYSGFSTVSMQTAQAFMDAFSANAGTLSSGNGSRVALALGADSGVCGVDACPAPLATPWGVWGGGVAGAGTVAGDASTLGVSYNLGGFAAGIDYRFDRKFLAGVTAGYTTSAQYTQQIDGRGTSDTVQMGVYGEYTEGAFLLDGLAGFARSQNQMQRTIVVPGLQPRGARGNTTANQFFGQLEAAYRLGLDHPDDASLLPFARLQGATSTQAAFSEWGADSLDLNVAQQTTNSLRTVTGAELDGKIARVEMTFRVGWSHEFADTTRPVTASFAGAPALSFTTQGAVAPRDGAVLGLGAKASIADATSLYARYDGEIQGGNTAHIFSAGLRMVW